MSKLTDYMHSNIMHNIYESMQEFYNAHHEYMMYEKAGMNLKEKDYTRKHKACIFLMTAVNYMEDCELISDDERRELIGVIDRVIKK